MEGFWSMIAGEDHQRRNTIWNPIIQVFDSWMRKRILGRIRETKITNTELNLLYSALIAKQPIDHTHLMINRWCCGNIEFGRYWFGVLPLHVGYLFKIGYYKEPRASLTRDFPFEYMKGSRNISEDDRGGFKVSKVNFPLSEGRLRLFLEGKKDWLEEGLLVSAKKNKREGL
jgi:hypothetical protein